MLDNELKPKARRVPVQSHKIEREDSAGPSSPDETRLWQRYVHLGKLLYQQSHGVDNCPHVKQIFSYQLTHQEVLMRDIFQMRSSLNTNITHLSKQPTLTNNPARSGPLLSSNAPTTAMNVA